MTGFVAEAVGPHGFRHYRVEIHPGGIEYQATDRPAEGYFLPGFVDLHIHGGFGIDFMAAGTEPMATLDCRLAELGYEAYLPTTVTAPPDSIRGALASLDGATHAAGFHLEGPFLSPEFPGAQDPKHIGGIKLGNEEWEANWNPILEDERLRIVTLAPELSGALDLICLLTKRGVAVSMGHSSATFDEARLGFEYGAGHTTHTFNAMRGIHHRELGLAGYTLLNPDLYAEVIYDRKHISREAMALLLATKPLEKILAVSDGTMATGLPVGTEIELWGRPATVGDGDVRLADGTLAGSTITLLDAFRNLCDDFGAAVAIQACCLNPRRAIRLARQPRRYQLFDYSLQLAGTWSVDAL